MYRLEKGVFGEFIAGRGCARAGRDLGTAAPARAVDACPPVSHTSARWTDALEKEFLRQMVFSVYTGGSTFEESKCIECYECTSWGLCRVVFGRTATPRVPFRS